MERGRRFNRRLTNKIENGKEEGETESEPRTQRRIFRLFKFLIYLNTETDVQVFLISNFLSEFFLLMICFRKIDDFLFLFFPNRPK